MRRIASDRRTQGAAVAVLIVAASLFAIARGSNEAVAPAAVVPLRSPAGVWVIHQLTSNTITAQTGTALNTPGVVGYGPRIPVNMILSASCTVSTSVLDTQRAYSLARGKLFKPRIIWGKYTPACARGPALSGFNAPVPYLAGGAPNTAFETNYAKVLTAEAAWAADKPDVRELDCGWYSLNYSELYNGPEVQTLYGATVTTARSRFVAAHNRLVDIAYNAASPVGVPVGFGLSGHGPITEISGGIAQHLATFPLGTVYQQANGWNHVGEWGGAGESGQDQAVWVATAGEVASALQDIVSQGRTAAQVTQMWNNARTLQSQGVLIVYVEQYDFQWTATSAYMDEFRRQIGLFVPSGLGVPSPTPDPSAELAELRARLVDLQAQVAALGVQEAVAQDNVAAAAADLLEAQAASQAAQQVLSDVQAQQAAVNAEIQEVQDRIAALGG